MKRSRAFLLLVSPFAALLVAGCGADVPENPTWVADVHPIMIAHCIRCHNDTGHGDRYYLAGTPGPNFDYATFADLDAAGLVAYMQGSDLAPGITQDTERGDMPPPPAAKLLDWQIETFRRWSKNPR